MPSTLRYSTTLDVLSCGECEIPFAMPRNLHQSAKQDGRLFYCPNGHKIGYSEPDNAKLKRQLASRDAQITHLRDQRDAAEGTARAYKGHVTRIKRRVSNGVCPCCQRTFANLARHMAGQHPEFTGDNSA